MICIGLFSLVHAIELWSARLVWESQNILLSDDCDGCSEASKTTCPGRSWDACALLPGSLIDWKAVEWLPWLVLTNHPSRSSSLLTHWFLLDFCVVQLIMGSEGVGVRWVQGGLGGKPELRLREQLRWSEEVTEHIKIIMGLKSGERYFWCWTKLDWN